MTTAAAKPVARAGSQPGKRMRSQLLDAAAARFIASGFADVSVAEIAEDAGAFPSQVTYYFGSKEALFVEAACREILHVAAAAESATANVRTGDAYVEGLVRTVIGAPGLKLFVEALALAQRRPEFNAQIQRTFERLDHEGDRALHDYRVRVGAPESDSLIPARRFWAIAIGMGARGAAMDEPFDLLVQDMLALLRDIRVTPEPQMKKPRGKRAHD